MNTETIKGNWNQIKGEFKEEYGKAINDKSTEGEGKVDQIVGKIQEKYGLSKEDIKAEISKW